jgi:biofilm PGA synthesis N-glycosyltransferase PgaC
VESVLDAVTGSWVFLAALFFVAAYPLFTSTTWIITALMYRRMREVTASEEFFRLADEDLPSISLLVPAYEEAVVLDDTLKALHELDYPDFEVVVVDDASSDETSVIARRHVDVDERFRLLRKELNEGKAMAMNDAMPFLRGDIMVVVDADAQLQPAALRPIAAHFAKLPRVGAVTGNPRVTNRVSLLAELQTLEFTSIVSILRRAQVVWGRLVTVSGVISAFRKNTIHDVGDFDPAMATEDIELSWRVQRNFYDIRYEPRALIDMHVPTTTRSLWKQRRRWATGLTQVLRHYTPVLMHWRNRRQWPIIVETWASVLWAHVFVATLLVWVLCLATGADPVGASPFPNAWGMLIATMAVLQLGTGVLLDRRYDPRVTSAFLIAPLYPIGYWFLMALVTVRSTIPTLLTPHRSSVSQWRTEREAAPSA